MQTISYEDVPCWYHLNWLPHVAALSIAVHSDCLPNITRITQESLLVRNTMREKGFDNFADIADWEISKMSGSGNKPIRWGFNDSLQVSQHNDEWLVFITSLPQVEYFIDSPCRECNGEKSNTWDGRSCTNCLGTGKNKLIDYSTAYAAVVSLRYLLFYGLGQRIGTKSELKQFLTVNTATEREMGGYGLCGEFSSSFTKWLKEGGQRDLAEVAEAMFIAYSTMFLPREFDTHCFGACVADDNGTVHLDVPGNRCSVYSKIQDNGAQFSSHNVDNVVQQLSLLVGLATLETQARK